METENMKPEFLRQWILSPSQFLKLIVLIFIAFSIFGCASLNSTYFKSRIRAVNKLSDQNKLYEIALYDDVYEVRDAAMKHLSQSLLVKATAESQLLKVRLQAVSFISDQTELMNIAQNNNNWDVRKAAFKKLNDNSLDILTRDAKDPALILSAKIRLGRSSWHEAFSGKNNSLSHVIGAAAIVDVPQPTSYDVVSACHNFIKLGDASRIPELINLLNRFGNLTLAEDYMNCGQSTLSDAGCAWGRANGYKCTIGSGSHRVSWGSENK